jgi:multiple sugar transport system permease protein
VGLEGLAISERAYQQALTRRRQEALSDRIAVLYLGRLMELGPAEVTEASLVDGASYWQRVTRVILPLTLRSVLLVTLVSVIGSLLAFDQFYIMTAGQPQNETATSVFYVYLNSFPYLRLGYGAALSMILALTILAFTVVQLLLTRRSHA